MSAKSSRGLKICISKGSVTSTKITPTAISKAKPAEITAAAAPAVGTVIQVKTVGFPELDNKMFVVGTAAAGKFTLVGSNTTGSTGALSGSPVMESFADTDMVCLCLSSVSINADTPGTVAVGTYCDPTAAIPSAATSAGTLDFAGFVDVTDPDYIELLAAVDDGIQRYMRITLPNNGFIVAPITISSVTWDLPLDGAVGYSGSAVLGSKPRHVF